MVAAAARSHHAAATLLLQAARALRRDHLDPSDVGAVLAEAFAQYARAYLAQRTLFGGEATRPDAVVDEWFALVPHALAAKGAAVLRKINYLSLSSPYRPPADDEPEWDAERVRDELERVVDELGALLASETTDAPAPDIRGEADLCPRPGTVVRYVLYDWGQWTETSCVVIRSRPPGLLLRFEDRHYEEVDATIALVLPVPGAAVDLDDPFEQQRTRFELLLFGDDIGSYDAPPFAPALGIGKAVVTCSCCGYPTRRLRHPAFLRLQAGGARPAPCALCGWTEAAEPRPLDAPPTEPLRHARLRARRSTLAFPADDASDLAAAYRDPQRLALTARLRTLFDGLLDAGTPSERAPIWAAAEVILRLLGEGPEGYRTRDRGQQRVTLAVQQAFAALS